MKRIVLAMLAASVLTLAGGLPRDAWAQTHGGTGILKIKPAARATGMGQAGVALSQRAHSVWWNPALLSDIQRPEVSSTMAKLVPDLADDVYYLNMAYAGTLGDWGGYGVDVMYLSYGQTEATTEEGESRGFFTSYEFVPAVGAGLKLYAGEPHSTLTDIDVGMAMKYVRVDLAPAWAMSVAGVENKDGSADAFGVDIGFALRGEILRPFAVGVNVQNLGSNLVFIDADDADPLPRNLKMGLAVDVYDSEFLRVVGAFDFNKALISYPEHSYEEQRPQIGWGDMKELLNMGAEFSIHDRLHFRLGYVDDPEGEIEALTFGAGLDVSFGSSRTIRFDYSSVPQALDLARVSYLSVGMQL
ncbi:MAG: PorV/PorQ family protein [Candidatus Eisenbacteria bacterium]